MKTFSRNLIIFTVCVALLQFARPWLERQERIDLTTIDEALDRDFVSRYYDVREAEDMNSLIGELFFKWNERMQKAEAEYDTNPFTYDALRREESESFARCLKADGQFLPAPVKVYNGKPFNFPPFLYITMREARFRALMLEELHRLCAGESITFDVRRYDFYLYTVKNDKLDEYLTERYDGSIMMLEEKSLVLSDVIEMWQERYDVVYSKVLKMLEMYPRWKPSENDVTAAAGFVRAEALWSEYAMSSYQHISEEFGIQYAGEILLHNIRFRTLLLEEALAMRPGGKWAADI